MSHPEESHDQAASTPDPDIKNPGANPPLIDARVCEEIARILPAEPTVLAVSKALDMTVRTLQRRLSTAGTSYRQILDDLRRRRAESELISSSRNVAEISRRLGYSDPAHFVRAFRRWTDQTPSHFAKAASAADGQVDRPTTTGDV
jgi:AraC-like DNA-binding protein